MAKDSLGVGLLPKASTRPRREPNQCGAPFPTLGALPIGLVGIFGGGRPAETLYDPLRPSATP